MTEDLNWVKELDYEPHLTGDIRDIAQRCGIDVVILLWQHYSKMHVYVSENDLVKLKKEYILQNSSADKRELARKLRVSERFVYEVLASGKDENQLGMFEGER